MRKLVVSTLISLDGYHEGPDKNVMALPFDPGFSAYNLRRLRAAQTLVLGRTTFEGFRDYWPSLADDDTQNPVEREISRRNNILDKLVVSDTLAVDQTGPWSSTTRIVPRAEAADAIAECKSGDGGDLLVFGSRTVWNHLLVAGLVDELHVMVGPALLGAGGPVFDGSTPVSLRLLESRVFEDSQLILARYAVKPS